MVHPQARREADQLPHPGPELRARAFRREVALPYLRLLPPGFSCVTTITLAFLSNQHDVRYVPIEYAKRSGTSKFRFVSDAYRYILQVLRMVMYFNPLKVLMPVALFLLGLGIGKGIFDMVVHPLYFAINTVLIFVTRADHRLARPAGRSDRPIQGRHVMSSVQSAERPTVPKRARSFGNAAVIDICLAAAVGLSVLLVHDVRYMLSHPFWVDEAWVVDTVRARIGLTPSLTSSTPLGWVLLLRLVPFGGAQRFRLVTLAFAMLAAAAGYLFGRELRLTPCVTGILTGAAVLLSPAMLLRDDLKQYTAEAFACVLLWVLVARIENEWRLRRLVAIAAVGSVGLFFADTVIFIGVAAMASLALECLVNRHYRRLIQVAWAAAGMLAVGFAVYEIFIRPHVTRILVNDWSRGYMPTRSASAAAAFLAGSWDITSCRTWASGLSSSTPCWSWRASGRCSGCGASPWPPCSRSRWCS